MPMPAHANSVTRRMIRGKVNIGGDSAHSTQHQVIEHGSWQQQQFAELMKTITIANITAHVNGNHASRWAGLT
jgi:hypothetical protein